MFYFHRNHCTFCQYIHSFFFYNPEPSCSKKTSWCRIQPMSLWIQMFDLRVKQLLPLLRNVHEFLLNELLYKKNGRFRNNTFPAVYSRSVLDVSGYSTTVLQYFCRQDCSGQTGLIVNERMCLCAVPRCCGHPSPEAGMWMSCRPFYVVLLESSEIFCQVV